MFEPTCYETVLGDGTQLLVCNEGGGFQVVTIAALAVLAAAMILVLHRTGVIFNAVNWLWRHARGEIDIKDLTDRERRR